EFPLVVGLEEVAPSVAEDLGTDRIEVPDRQRKDFNRHLSPSPFRGARQIGQVLAVLGLLHPVGRAQETVELEPAFMEGYLLDAGHVEALAFLDGLYEGARRQEVV